MFAENARGYYGIKSGQMRGIPQRRGRGRARRRRQALGTAWHHPTTAGLSLHLPPGDGVFVSAVGRGRPGRPHLGAAAALKS